MGKVLQTKMKKFNGNFNRGGNGANFNRNFNAISGVNALKKKVKALERKLKKKQPPQQQTQNNVNAIQHRIGEEYQL